jgi:hypothetical protein
MITCVRAQGRVACTSHFQTIGQQQQHLAAHMTSFILFVAEMSSQFFYIFYGIFAVFLF